MKTLQQVIDTYESRTLDGRDLERLAIFLPEEAFPKFDLELKPEFKGKHIPKELTKENILIKLKQDVEFAFEKALNKRGISAALMWQVVSMWNWILEEGLEDYLEENYAQYGLPLFKATALKYDFPNPIGNDRGDEFKYSAEYNEYH